jgi:hypothetical protein
VTTVSTVLPAADAGVIFCSRFNLSGHGLASVESTFGPSRPFYKFDPNRTFEAGPTEGLAFLFSALGATRLSLFNRLTDMVYRGWYTIFDLEISVALALSNMRNSPLLPQETPCEVMLASWPH